jgi:hypothetical protein
VMEVMEATEDTKKIHNEGTKQTSSLISPLPPPSPLPPGDKYVWVAWLATFLCSSPAPRHRTGLTLPRIREMGIRLKATFLAL